jgi:Nucleotidyltransferase domain.
MINDQWIEKFQREALPQIIKNLKPKKILLFGSRVTGNATQDSDLDIILISDVFKDIPFVRRMEMVLKIARFEKHIDYLCYTSEEFEKIKNSSSIIQNALECCIEV